MNMDEWLGSLPTLDDSIGQIEQTISGKKSAWAMHASGGPLFQQEDDGDFMASDGTCWRTGWIDGRRVKRRIGFMKPPPAAFDHVEQTPPLHKPHPAFLDLALSSGAVLTGKPDGSEAITVVFSIKAWRQFDNAVHAPIDMVLHCPACGLQHIDAPDVFKPTGLCTCAGPDKCETCFSNEELYREWLSEGPWANPPHRSHLCHGCGHIWRPADVPTNGVVAVKTRGQNDSPILERS